MVEPHPMVRCHAKNRRGEQCQHYTSPGLQVCHMHGGKSPHALAKAEERLRDLVHPSISRLSELIIKADSDAVSLNAVRYVLDWAGYRAAADGAPEQPHLRVTVSFDHAESDSPTTLSLPDAS